MTARRSDRPATYQDVLAAAPHQIAEVVNGALHLQPRPAGPHARTASVLGMDIGGPFDRGRGGPGGWFILYEPELHLAEDIVVPDLAGWRRERMPEVQRVPFFTLAPDWVAEVLSRSTAAVDRGEKMDLYAREGVQFLWLVDPLARTLEAFLLESTRWVPLGTWRDDTRVRVPPFEAIELELSAMWVPGAEPVE